MLLIIVSHELLKVRTLQRGSVEWKAKAQVAGKCFDSQTAGIYHRLQECRHMHRNTHTPELRAGRPQRKLGAPTSACRPCQVAPWGSGPPPRRWSTRIRFPIPASRFRDLRELRALRALRALAVQSAAHSPLDAAAPRKSRYTYP